MRVPATAVRLACLAAFLGLAGCETPRAIQPGLAVMPAARSALTPPPASVPDTPIIEDETGWRLEGRGAEYLPSANTAGPIRNWSVRFDQAPIAAVADAVLGQNVRRPFRVDSRVQGALTISLVGRMSDGEALSSFDRALRGVDAALVQEGSGFAVVPKAEADRLRGPPTLASGAGGFNSGASIFQARHISSAELVRLLQPLAGSEAQVRADPAREQVYISGDPTTVGALLRTAAALDVDWMQGRSFQFFPVRYATPGGLAGEVRQILGGSEGPIGNQIQILEMDRLNGLLVIARTPVGLDRAGEWIARLDRPAARASRRLRSIPLANLEAQALVETLSTLMATEGAGRASAPAPQEGSGAAPQAGGSSATLGTLRITADPRTNSLVLLADDGEYRDVLDIVRELDAPPPQVLIEATIAEVTLNDRLRFGVQWFFDNDSDFTGGFASGSDDSAPSSYPGFSLRYLTTDVRAVLNALSTVTDVQLLSTPRLLVLSNESAELQVGDQVPIITQSAVGLNGDSRIVNTVQYRDTGVVLSVTPRVSESGRMFIAIEQEVSEVSGTTTSDIDSPTIQQRRLSTRIQVEDGQLIVLGGLLRSSTSTGDTGIPYLSQIPGIGALFRSRDTTRRQTELVMFLRPTVVRSRREIDAVTEELVSRMQALGVPREPASPQ
jgi:general secretion pathway protein D